MNAYNIVFLTSLLLSYLTDQLISANACVYNGHDKGIIDLSTVGNVDGTPMWKDLSPETPDDHRNMNQYFTFLNLKSDSF